MPSPTNTQFAVAVHVLTYLAGAAGRPVSSEELAGSTNVTGVHIRRVLGPLRDAGLVQSRPGPGGGWALAGNPTAITLDRVWTLLQGDDPVLGLHGPNPACPVGRGIRSSLEALDAEVALALRRRLSAVTVADLLREAADEAGDEPGAAPGGDQPANRSVAATSSARIPGSV
ncbi:Rrf2 family protein [Friedmanniella endophytica]|uniref:Rrf2 family protein n=1 Tax=Microlunatus kandeliicorticis TaxID=1759536 RepID=A0A7W3IV70_9ACTN|nr:Rrf2 family transcriptional regulator [Microlunatus kandeliicorticis]MBA8795832.1 Rrf2 family protein [Microlunatus kandeliicorticis]